MTKQMKKEVEQMVEKQVAAEMAEAVAEATAEIKAEVLEDLSNKIQIWTANRTTGVQSKFVDHGYKISPNKNEFATLEAAVDSFDRRVARARKIIALAQNKSA